MTRVDDLAPAIRDLYTPELREFYSIHEWRNATVIFKQVHPQEWADLLGVLTDFRLYRSDIEAGGGN